MGFVGLILGSVGAAPAVVHPKPAARLLPDLGLEPVVHPLGVDADILFQVLPALDRKRPLEFHEVTRAGQAFHKEKKKRRPPTEGGEGRESGGQGRAAKKIHLHAPLLDPLVHQGTDNLIFFEAPEGLSDGAELADAFESGESPHPEDVVVKVGIFEGAGEGVDLGPDRAADQPAGDQGGDFPIPAVRNKKHRTAAPVSDRRMDPLDPFNGEIALFRSREVRHPEPFDGEFCDVNKRFLRNLTDFGLGFFPFKGFVKIFEGLLTVSGKELIEEIPGAPRERERDREREEIDEAPEKADQRVFRELSNPSQVPHLNLSTGETASSQKRPGLDGRPIDLPDGPSRS